MTHKKISLDSYTNKTFPFNSHTKLHSKARPNCCVKSNLLADKLQPLSNVNEGNDLFGYGFGPELANKHDQSAIPRDGHKMGRELPGHQNPNSPFRQAVHFPQASSNNSIFV